MPRLIGNAENTSDLSPIGLKSPKRRSDLCSDVRI